MQSVTLVTPSEWNNWVAPKSSHFLSTSQQHCANHRDATHGFMVARSWEAFEKSSETGSFLRNASSHPFFSSATVRQYNVDCVRYFRFLHLKEQKDAVSLKTLTLCKCKAEPHTNLCSFRLAIIMTASLHVFTPLLEQERLIVPGRMKLVAFVGLQGNKSQIKMLKLLPTQSFRLSVVFLRGGITRTQYI